MKDESFRFSVWTATFNRGILLHKVYKSLKDQTYKNFEWLIIDDGSSDDTEEIVSEFISENVLKSIIYVKKENGGKHTAWRQATKMFRGDYVVTIDSDDTLTSHALEVFDRYWKDLEQSDDYNDFWEVKARAVYEDGRLIGRPLPKRIFDSNAIEFAYRYRFRGDLHGCRKVSVLKTDAKVPDSFIFEEHCSNLKESVRWFRAARKYKTRYIEEVTECVNVIAEDRLTSSISRPTKIYYNHLVGALFMLDEQRKAMFKWNKMAYFKTLGIILYFSFLLGKNPFQLIKKRPFDLIVLTLGYIPVYLIYRLKN